MLGCATHVHGKYTRDISTTINDNYKDQVSQVN